MISSSFTARTLRLALASLLCLTLCSVPSIRAHGDHGHSHGGHDGEVNENVLVLNSHNFEQAIGSHPVVMVEFFAPWCGHCKQLKPQYEAAADQLSGMSSPARLATVDCTVEKELCSQHGVKGFPTLKTFFGVETISAPADYKGGRTAADIVSFMKKQSEPAFTRIDDEAAALAWVAGATAPALVVGIFPEADSEAAKAFQTAATSMKNDYVFAISSSPKVWAGIKEWSLPAAVLEAPSSSSVSVIKPAALETESPVALIEPTELSLTNILSFIQVEAFPLIGEIGPENYQSYMERGLPLTWVFYDPSASSADFFSALSTAAKQFKGKVSVVRLDGVKWADHMKHFGLPSTSGTTPDLPALVIEDRASGRNFFFSTAFSTDFTSDNFVSFFQGFLDKTLVPHVKSEAVPTENDGPVRTLVGTTFEAEVLNSDKDVFVEFYAPWCGHCKSLAPKWEELGQSFSDNDNVVIAKVDATANDTPAKISGFPTLIFYPKGGKDSPMVYDGDRTPSAMVDFVKANGGTFSGAATHSEL